MSSSATARRARGDLGAAGRAQRAATFAAFISHGLLALDVSMNTQAVTVERAAGRPLMSGFHGSWSIGAFVGAGIGVLGVAAPASR